MEANAHVFDSSEIRYRKNGVFSQEIWPTISSVVVFIITSKYITIITQWRPEHELVMFAILITIAWMLVGYPILTWKWGIRDDKGYRWNEMWFDQINFVTKTLVIFSATLIVNVGGDEFEAFGFSMVESAIFLWIIVLQYYGIKGFMVQLLESI